jgi:hypothetical protein
LHNKDKEIISETDWEFVLLIAAFCHNLSIIYGDFLPLRAPAAVNAPAASKAEMMIMPTTIIPLPPATGEAGSGVAVGSGELVTVQKTNGVAVG